ncbi:hypothetical protein [Opitutus sp. ER46]|uniref:hypothetical protein n=1 Tax=Opitutus sp. ER46 TaxID=2161864 RepID=UPI0011B2480D|nr:hypothetical protein [Opitutus sp. ER46]
MNTILKTLALVLAAAVPAAFTAETNGLNLPAALATGNLLLAFGAVLTVLTMVTDYRVAKPLATHAAASAPVGPRSPYQLAA